MKISVNPSNRIVMLINDKGENLKGFIIDDISVYSIMYQKENEKVWNEIRVSYDANSKQITIFKNYKENTIIDILPDNEIKSFFITSANSIVFYENGKIIGNVK